MNTKAFIFTAILTLIFNNCMAKKDTNSQTDNRKIVSVTLEYYDVAKVRELQRTLPYPKYVEEIEKQAHKFFDVDSTHWELILNVKATAKYDEEQYDKIKNPHGITRKMPPNDFTLTIKYDDESVDEIRIWEGGRISMSGSGWYFVNDKYFTAFYQMLNSYISIMAQEKQPKILFEQQNTYFLLEQDKDTKTFLTSVCIQTPVNYNSEMDDKEFQKVEFMMRYYYTRETETSRYIYSYIAYFVPNGANYKIHEAGYLYNWFWREDTKSKSIISMWQEMSFQVEPQEIVYIGNSDNDKLIAVKVWKYVTKHWKK